MSEEEKQAIENLEEELILSINVDSITTEVRNEYVKIILNYIDKLKKENEEYHRIKKELIRVNKKIYDVDTIEEFIETIDKLQKENQDYKKLILVIKEKLNNIQFEVEQSWRKIEKLESKYE